MKILIVGLPGSGKTTQIDKTAEKYNLKPLRMGNILREIAATGSEMGNKIKAIMASGELVDDSTVASLIKSEAEKINDDYIMEGYPRTTEQVDMFNPGFDKVFYLEVPITVLKDRMKGRGRADDSEGAIETRIRVQQEDLEKILDFYSPQLVRIDGTKSIDEIFAEIERNLG
jgi:adenylate kinase